MKKRLISVLFCLLFVPALLLFLPQEAQALTEGGITYTVTNGKATLTRLSVTDEEYRIPETVGGYPLTALAKGFIKYNSYVKTLYIPGSIQTIPYQCFRSDGRTEYCPENVIFEGEDVENLESMAFYLAEELKTCVLPSGLKRTPDAMFRSSGLETITLPEGLQVIGSETFYACKSLTHIGIPNSLKRIEDRGVYSCELLIGDIDLVNVTYIGKEAFDYCHELKTAKIHRSDCTIASDAFIQCYSLNLYGHKDSTAFRYCENDTAEQPVHFRCLDDSDHVFTEGDGIVALEPTADYFGLRVWQCRYCRQTKKQSIPKLTAEN